MNKSILRNIIVFQFIIMEAWISFSWALLDDLVEYEQFVGEESLKRALQIAKKEDGDEDFILIEKENIEDSFVVIGKDYIVADFEKMEAGNDPTSPSNSYKTFQDQKLEELTDKGKKLASHGVAAGASSLFSLMTPGLIGRIVVGFVGYKLTHLPLSTIIEQMNISFPLHLLPSYLRAEAVFCKGKKISLKTGRLLTNTNVTTAQKRAKAMILPKTSEEIEMENLSSVTLDDES